MFRCLSLCLLSCAYVYMWRPFSWLSDKEPACYGGDQGSVPELRRFPGEGDEYTL